MGTIIRLRPMLIAILNHERNDQTVELVKGFRPYADVIAIDSGSNLEDRHRSFFHVAFPTNIHYSAQINAAYTVALEQSQQKTVFFITSDVGVSDYEKAVQLASEAFRQSDLGVYAPSTTRTGSGHPQMWNRGSNRLRRVVFTEGFCFAARLTVLQRLCPIDTAVNRIGWGVDVYLGYLALQTGLASFVDDRIIVTHPLETTYSVTEARRQYRNWFAQHPPSARFFRWLTGIGFMKTDTGARIVHSLPWTW